MAFETIRDARADLIRAHLHFAILFDNLATTGVTTLEDAVTGDLVVPTTAKTAGIIEKKAGVSITHNIDSTDVEGYGEAEPVRTIISKRVITFDAEYVETNRTVLELFWGTYFDANNLTTSALGGTTIKAPTLPKNLFYRCYLVATDDYNGDDIFAYYIMPRVKLVKVDNSDSKDDNAVSYKMTFQAFRDATLGFSVLQGWCGPGWRKLIDKTGFVALTTAVTVSPATKAMTVAAGVGKTQQLVVTANNGINRTPDSTFVSSAPAIATVSATGLITTVAAGSATITATYQPITGGAPLTGTCVATVT